MTRQSFPKGNGMRNSLLSLMAAFSLIILTAVPATATWVGGLDVSFSGDGKVLTDVLGGADNGSDVAIQTDGKIIVAGVAVSGDQRFAVARYNANGSLDGGFGTGGIVTTDIASGYNDLAQAVAIQPDGKIVVAGYYDNSGPYNIALVRYTSAGVLDGTFGTGGIVTQSVGSTTVAYSVAVDASDRIVVVGASDGQVLVLRYDSSGNLDTSFDSDGIVTTTLGGASYAYDVAIQPHGKIVVAGEANPDGSAFLVLRYNDNGSLDTSFSNDGISDGWEDFGFPDSAANHSAQAVALMPDGKIVVAGYSSSPLYMALARLAPDGSFDTTFSGDGKVTYQVGSNNTLVRDVAVQTDGRIVVAGFYDNGMMNEGNDSLLVRFNADGSLDSNFGTNGYAGVSMVISSTDEFNALALQPDGKIVATGFGTNDISVARFHDSPEDLVGWYRLDGDGTDASGYGNNGTVTGAVPAADQSGSAGSAYDFNGVSDFIEVPDSDSLDVTNAITLSAWIKPLTTSGRYVVLKGKAPGSSGVYTLDIYPGTIRAGLLKDGDFNPTLFEGVHSIAFNQWQHIAMTWDGSTISIYYNGQLDFTDAFIGPLSVTDGTLKIGSYHGSGFFNGTIDDVRVYDRALTQRELQDAMGQRIYVDFAATGGPEDGLSWATAKTTIQAAIDGAVAGDTIWVKQGNYPLSAPVLVNKDVHLYGSFLGTETSPEDRDLTTLTTIVNGQNSVLHVFHITASAVVDGFNITGGNASGSGNDGIGGGIFAKTGSSTIRNCSILSNTAALSGGGIATGSGSSNTISNCSISNNTAGNFGGGLALNGVDLFSDSQVISNRITINTPGNGGNGAMVTGASIISNVDFYANGDPVGPPIGYGGGLFTDNDKPVIKDSTFYLNRAAVGGGAYVKGTSGGGTSTSDSPVFDNCFFWQNSAEDGSAGHGGGMFINGSSPTIRKTIFQENSARLGVGLGGGISMGGGPGDTYFPVIENSLFGLNYAVHGGGIYVHVDYAPQIINCTIVGNSAYDSDGEFGIGGGIYVTPDFTSPEIHNSIIYGNTVGLTGGTDPQIFANPSGVGGSSFTLTYSNVEEGSNLTPTIPSTSSWDRANFNVAPNTGNIDADPLFLDSDGPDDDPLTWFDNNLQLGPGSPSIDTASAAGAPADDFLGTIRPQGAGVDMGAYESNPGVAYELTNAPVGFGDPNNYSTYRMITVPAGVGAGLYAGIFSNNGAQVYQYNTGTESWDDITPTGATLPAWSTDNAGINAMHTVGGYMFVGTYNGVTGTQICRKGTNWDTNCLTTDGFGLGGAAYSTDSMTEYDFYTYAAAAKGTGVGIMRYNGGTSWTQVNIDDGFYSASGNYRAHAMIEYDGLLYVGTENGSGAELWTYNGTSWTQVNLAAEGFSTGNTIIRSMAVYNGNLYIATNNPTTGLEVWEFDGSSWRQANTNGFGNPNNVQAKSMVVHDGALYVGTDNSIDGGEVWKFNGNTWTPYLLGGVGGDANNLYVNSLASYGGALYVGTYNTVDGTEIWATSDSLPTYTLTISGAVRNQINQDGYYTVGAVEILDFNGTLPDDISDIRVKFNGVDMGLNKSDFTFDFEFNEFYYSAPGAPGLGTYEFIVTAGATTATDTDTQTIIRGLPSTYGLYPSNNTTVARPEPTFSWTPVFYSDPGPPVIDVPLYYRLEIAENDGGSAGARVFATDRVQGMYHFTVAPGTLTPGSYLWRVRVTDADTYKDTENRTQTGWQLITIPASFPTYTRTPAIDDDNLGVITWSRPGTDPVLYFWVRVVDHEGIRGNGTSHQVKVNFPNFSPSNAWDGTELMLKFVRGEGEDLGTGIYRTAYYETDFINLNGADPTGLNGDYIVTVTDPDGNTGSFTDTLEVNLVNPVPESSITADLKNNLSESITAHFDNVQVDSGSGLLPYDDFSTYSLDINQAVASGNWAYYNGDVSIVDTGSPGFEQIQMITGGTVGRGNANIAFANPAAIKEITTDVTITSISTPDGSPRARISGYWFNNGSADCWVSVNVKGDRVTYTIDEQYIGTTYYWSPPLQEGELLTTGITTGTVVRIGVKWDESTLPYPTLTVSADASPFGDPETATYQVPGGVSPTMNEKNLQVRTNLVTSVTPTFAWAAPVAPVGGQAPSHYRVRIYNYNSTATIWNGYTGNPAAGNPAITVPPGVLDPNSYYRFRVEARDGHQGLEMDNWSRTPASPNDYYIFYTGPDTDDDPFISFDGHGVFIHNQGLLGNLLSFWVEVHDAQGVPSTIKSVKVEWNDGTAREADLYYDADRGGDASTGYYWRETFYTPTATTYTFTVEDWDGNTYTITEDLTVDPIGAPAETNISPNPTPDPSLGTTGVNFSWDAVPDAAFYRIEIYDREWDRKYYFNSPTNTFTLPPGVLEENAFYKYRIQTRREYFEQNVDNMSKSPWDGDKYPNFITTAVTGGSSSPTIDLDGLGVYVEHLNIPALGGDVYALSFEVRVTDNDRVPENIKTVTVTYPDTTTTQELEFSDTNGLYEGTYRASLIIADPGTIQNGTYTFSVTDFDGNISSNVPGVTDDDLNVNPLPVPTALWPKADSMLSTTNPVIDWTDVDGAAFYQVKIRKDYNSHHSSPYLTASNYSVPGGVLVEKNTYHYEVHAFREDPAVEVDNVSFTMPIESEQPHFMAMPYGSSDGDSIDNNWEDAWFGNTTTVDDSSNYDGDDLLDVDEYNNNTNPLIPDTDGDGIDDSEEIANGTDPLTADALEAPTGVSYQLITGGLQIKWENMISDFVAVEYAVANRPEVWADAELIDTETVVSGSSLGVNIFTFQGNSLHPFTPYYFRLRTVNDATTPTAFSAYTPVLLVPTASPPPTPAPYAMSQIAGDWVYHELSAGDAPQWNGWGRGNFNIDASGNITSDGVDSEGGSYTGDTQVGTLTPDGLLIIDDQSNTTITISSDRSLGTYTYDDSSGAFAFGIAVKRDPAVTYATTDLFGTWQILQIIAGDDPEINSWYRAEMTVDSGGVYTLTNEDSSDGALVGIDNETLSIDLEGIISSSEGPNFKGVMNIDRNLFVYSNTPSGDGYHLGVAIKRSGSATFLKKDLIGFWKGRELYTGDGPDINGGKQMPGWGVVNTLTAADNSQTFYGADSDGSAGTVWLGGYDIDADGVMTLSANPSLYGVMSDDKRLSVQVITEQGSGTPQFAIFLKQSDDTDGDDMEDGWEQAFFGNLDKDGTLDSDDDDLTDLDEFNNGTDPTNGDTDGDGMEDGWEIRFAFDPLTADGDGDPDNDFLTNAEEFDRRTDPFNADTDADGHEDSVDNCPFIYNPGQSDLNSNVIGDVCEGIVAYYPMEGAPDDASGTGNDGIEVGGPVYEAGVVGQGVYLDGVDDYLQIANDPSIGPQEMTITAWVRPDSITHSGWIGHQHYIIVNKEGQYEIAIMGDNSQPPTTTGEIGFAVTPCLSWDDGDYIPPLSQFSHVVLTFDDSYTARVYANGQLTAERFYSGPLVQTNSCLRIGARGCSESIPLQAFFNGVIDEVHIYDRALSTAEVEAMYMDSAVQIDSDSDGLTDEEELPLGTDPYNSDTDGDGLSDGDEVMIYGTSPILADTDGDGLTDGAEVNTHGTDPTLADTDGDGFDDAAEIAAGSSPLDIDDTPEYVALVALYNATAGAGWTTSTNWLGAPGTQCTWYGVTCDGADHVIGIDLSGNNLVGTMPAELDLLQNLMLLNLGENQLSGGIPAGLGTLVNLEMLDLWRNQLSGGIPPALGNLESLTFMNLSENTLSGTIPVEFENLIFLTHLNLHWNLLTGNIPVELGNLVALEYLYLYGNQLNGAIPSELGDLANLKALYLGENQLTGTIPVELGNLSNLLDLDLFNNQLSGGIPTQLGSLTGLTKLNLRQNQLTGTIPTELGNLSLLEYLYLNTNQLTGSIPPELGNLSTMWHLNVANNQLSGTIPPQIGNLSSLLTINFYNNQLVGPVPFEITNLTTLYDNQSDFRVNALYAFDTAIIDFMNLKQIGGDWQSEQDVPPDQDSDGDGMPDSYEVANGLDPLVDDSAEDSDGDSLTNLEEFLEGTDPNLFDTDDDLLSDGEEVNGDTGYFTDPLNPDSDGDTLLDGDEAGYYGYGTDPNNADTDGDGVADNIEIGLDTDPLDENDFPMTPGTYWVDIDDSNAADDSQHGTSATAPWRTLHFAIDRINSGATGSYTLNVGLGTYKVGAGLEPDEELKITQSNVSIIGELGSMPVIDGTGANNWTYGIWSTASSVTIENLEVANFLDYGIKVEFATSGAVRNCVVHDLSGQYATGIVLNEVSGGVTVEGNEIFNQYNGIEVIDGSPVISRNTIVDNDYGIVVASYGGPAASPTIRNNVIATANFDATGIYIHADDSNGAASPLVYHNTIHTSAASTSAGIYLANSGGDVSPIIKFNAIDGWNVGIDGDFYDSGTPVIDYNIYYNNRDDYGTITPVNTPVKELNSQDPRYVDPAGGNFDLASGSPAIDAIPGSPSHPVSDDILGRSRPINAGYDMGAYESTGTANSAPRTPTANTPVPFAVVTGSSVMLNGEAYYDADGDPLKTSHWMIRRADGMYPASPSDEAGAMQHEVSGLVDGLRYAWKVRYEDAAGKTSGWSPEYYFTVGTPVVDAEVEVPAGSTVEAYSMFSVPSWASAGLAEAALGIEIDPSKFKFGTYDPLTGSYRELGDGLLLEPGRAYWFLARNGFAPAVNGVPVSMYENLEVKLHINPGSGNGWNMISPPNNAKYYWGDVFVVEYDSNGNEIASAMVSALNDPNDWIDVRLWRWEEGAYIEEGATFKMEHHDGYWVLAKKENVYLRFDHAYQQANLSMKKIMVAEARHRMSKLMDSGLISPSAAYAVNLNSPPQPMAGFSGSGFTADGGGGGCFVDTASEKGYGSAFSRVRPPVDGVGPWLAGAAAAILGLFVGVFALSIRRRR